MHAMTLLLVLLIALYLANRLVFKEFHLERTITINRSRDDVFAYIRMLRNDSNWNAWSLKDPAAETGFRGLDGTVGATTTWKSTQRELGTGEKEITEIIDGSKLTCQIRLFSPFKATFPSILQTESITPTQTQVTMIMHDTMRFPMGLICMLMGQHSKITTEFDTSLSNLRKIMEIGQS